MNEKNINTENLGGPKNYRQAKSEKPESSGGPVKKIIVGAFIIAVLLIANYLLENQNELEKKEKQMVENLQDEESGENFTDSQLEEIKPFWEALNKYDEKLQFDFNTLTDELHQYDIEFIISATMSEPKEIKEYFSDIRAYERILYKYDNVFETDKNEAAANFSAINLTDKIDRGKYNEILEMISKGNANIADFLRIKKNMVNAIKKLQQFIESKSGKYKVQDDLIRFSRSKDQEVYSAYVDKVLISRDAENRWDERQDDEGGMLDPGIWKLLKSMVKNKE